MYLSTLFLHRNPNARHSNYTVLANAKCKSIL